MVHALKIYPEYYEAVKSGKKPFEVRKNDGDFKIGDILALNEFDPLEGEKGQYTGRTIFQKISYILADEAYCKTGFVVIGISPCKLLDGEAVKCTISTNGAIIENYTQEVTSND